MYRRALRPAEGRGIDQAQHLGQHLQAPAQGLFQKVLFRRHQPVLHQRRSNGFRHHFLAAGLVEETENAALIDCVNRRVRIRVARQHHPDRVGR